MRKRSMEELERLSAEDFHHSVKNPVVLILDNIRSMHNVGSVFRTADAFRVESIFLCGYTPQPPHRDIHKTALGATETVQWLYFADPLEAVAEARKRNFLIWAVEQTDASTPLYQFQPPSCGTALVLGNEVEGVSDALLSVCDGSFEIPQWGMKHSLNVSVAAGIVLWEITRHTFIQH
ncbi:MAG: RNA methyltransferase [Sediminibacterium sp.]